MWFAVTRSLTAVCCCVLFVAGVSFTNAQVIPSATGRGLSVSVGVFGSVFQPDYAGNGVAQTSPRRLYGDGAFVDVKLSRWVQIEAESRWLRFHTYEDIREDNYMIGPRVPIYRVGRFTPYGKVLIGSGRMNFEYNDAWGRFTDVAYGGGVDVKLTRKVNLRAFDFEYQQWPNWLTSSLYPYGASVGVSYKVF